MFAPESPLEEKAMPRVRLIHWQVDKARERAAQLQSWGLEVEYQPLTPAALRSLREDPPGAIIIDLGRVPSQGRDLGLNLRIHKATRHVPLVFAGGEPEKVAGVRELLPDATYTTWDGLAESLRLAMAQPPTDPVVPRSTMAGYSGTPLPKKLGIKAHAAVLLDGAPEGFENTLGVLPEGAALTREPCGTAQVTLWFVTTRMELEARMEEMIPAAASGGLWILWPKKASGVASDLSQTIVRETGLAAGLVDFKVAAIDATWSGLRFSQRKTGSGAGSSA
jgi:hypothetical protein